MNSVIVTIPSFREGLGNNLKARFEKLMPLENNQFSYSYPKVPRKDQLLDILNEINEWQKIGQISKTDFEKYIIARKFFPKQAGSIDSFDSQINTSAGDVIHLKTSWLAGQPIEMNLISK